MDEGDGAVAEHVLFVVLDTVRARNTFVGGRDLTPTLERVGQSGSRFDAAIAPAPWTLPSHASIYTGRYPTEHGATHQHKFLADEFEPLPRTLSEAGFRCGLFTPNAYLTETFNMARGFDEVEFVRGSANKVFEEGMDPVQFLQDREHEAGIARFREIARAIADGPVVKNLANAVYFRGKDLLRGQDDQMAEPFEWDETAVESTRSFLRESVGEGDRTFAMVNLIGAHAPWPYDPDRLDEIGVDPESVAPERRWREVAAVSGKQWEHAAGNVSFDETDREILEHLYDSWIRAVDGLVDDLLSELDSLGIREETLVVLTADHGESILDDGVLGHNVTVDEVVAHVPLVVDGPTVPDERVDPTVSLKDLHPTVLSATGVDESVVPVFDAERQGSALIEMHGIDPDDLDEEFRDVAAEFGPRRAIYRDGARAERRYDTGETFGDDALLEELDAVVDGLDPFDATEGSVDVEGDVEDRLRELGYLG